MSDEKITIEGPGPLNPIGMPAIDWAKPVETTIGQPVHIYAIDHNLNQPVVGRLTEEKHVSTWYYDGGFMSNRQPSGLDLRNVREATK